ncbi:MAG: class I SAM-dependent methyltransferase [Pseudobdellovibrionaceae bacterium]
MSELTIGDVSDTSFWVAYYRAKETERSDALFRDPFAKILIGEKGHKISESMPQVSRYTEWSVISRTVIIDRFIEKAIQEGVDTILNLGAGLDSRPYRMKLPSDLEWIEADYPNIIRHKSELLKSETPTCRLTRVEIDLADDVKRREFLKSVNQKARKVLVITEGVIPYLSPEEVTELGYDLLAQKSFLYWITEYFDPRVYKYLRNTVRAAKLKNAPFKFYPDNWNGFFKNLGWVEKETRFGFEIAREFKRTPPMPLVAKLMMPFMSKKMKREAAQMAGYMIFTRGNSN